MQIPRNDMVLSVVKPYNHEPSESRLHFVFALLQVSLLVVLSLLGLLFAYGLKGRSD